MLRASLLLALLLLTAAPVTAQNPLNPALDFDIVIEQPFIDVDMNGNGHVQVLIRDLSRDSLGGNAPGAPTALGLPHNFEFEVQPLVDDPGWVVGTPPPIQLRGGEQTMVQVPFSVIGATKIESFIVNLTTRFRPIQAGDAEERYSTVGARTAGFVTFVATVKDTPQLAPRESAVVRIELQNLGLYETTYDFELTENTCDMPVVLPSSVYAPPKGTVTTQIELKSPWQGKLWYLAENCGLGVKIYPTGQEDVFSTNVAITVQVDGQSVLHVEKLFPVFVVLVLLLLLILFFLRRKARIEEEILGKPQKPWTIPVEVLYLRALRQKDERAWYVVRHHLMEEEYRSSLLWYAAYKKATKGTRKKEALVLGQEKTYERWKAAWAKDIAKPIRKADRFEAKLQRKLDRKARKQDRKDARKVRRMTKKMAAAHGKQVERALEKWQRETRKAEKKGLPLPKRPVLPEPDYPEEPEPRSVALADHKWSRKAERFRARMLRKQGDLEVKFEKADARQLAKLRRKVQRVARKLDDPDFVAEHPLLNADA